MQDRVDLISCETSEQDLPREPFPVQLRQEMAQAGEDLVTAVGQQEEEPVSRAVACQVVEKFQAGIIAPVQVFHYEQHRVRPGLVGQKVGQGLKAAALLLFGIESRYYDRRRGL